MIDRVLDGRYRIAGRLGQGGMGIVYLGRHEVLGTRVAIKVLRSDAAGDDESMQRLRLEAQAASAIGNEHIVDVRDFGVLDEGSVYVVMELIEGTDLYTLVRAAPLPWPRARHIAVQICEALQAAHDQGIVHRDLKLENVLLTTRRGDPDFVKIVDFGIAKVQGSAKITVAGRVIGTPEYMSPEQCMGRGVDHRTDIYSLGVMLYEMVTGQLPFYDDDLAKLVRMVMQERPVPPSRACPEAELPLALEAVILRCLAKEADARYDSMKAVADALGALDEEATEIAEEPVEEAVVARPTTTRTEAAPRSRRAGLFAALAVVALAGVASVIVLSTSEPPPPEPAAAATAPEPEEDPAPAAPEPAATPIEATPTPLPPAEPVAVDAPARSQEISIESTPPGADVFDANGALLGQTPFRVPRPAAGERLELELHADGYEAYSVALGELSAAELRVALARRSVRPVRVAAPPPPPAPRVEAPPPAPPPPRAPPPEATPERRHQEFLDPWGHQD